MSKKTICIDFDGVIYPNFKFRGLEILKGDPVFGVVDALASLANDFRIVINSARCSEPAGLAAIKKWLYDNGMDYEVVEHKPIAHIYVDDRAVCFSGDWLATMAEIKNFKQWQSAQKAKLRIAVKRFRRV